MLVDNVIRITQGCPMWPELGAHLERTGDLRHVSDGHGIKPELFFLGAIMDGRVVGHVSLKRDILCVPSEPPTAMHLGAAELWESFVQTFQVEEVSRRQGLGTALQQAAIELSRELGCYQMRSWSSLDKVANYHVKFQLGFAFCPGTFTVPRTGEQIPGGWFVKRL